MMPTNFKRNTFIENTINGYSIGLAFKKAEYCLTPLSDISDIIHGKQAHSYFFCPSMQAILFLRKETYF